MNDSTLTLTHNSLFGIGIQNYYESEGIILNDPEILPKDPYTDKRFLTLQKRSFTSSDVRNHAYIISAYLYMHACVVLLQLYSNSCILYIS